MVWPYPGELDLVQYPPKLKVSSLQRQEVTELAHILLQISDRDVVSNDAILARLFIGTLKFEWFMKLPEGSIKNWGDLEKLFLIRFFEGD